ncbi:MAG TPA: DUF1592 domain-containing protein [Bryobacteraceae bacterium]|nr:DUF1592 domain-containing protein [Bryobacteraceae bacterium]
MKIRFPAAFTTLFTSASMLLGQDAGPFTSTVRPVLAKHCFSCHNAKLTFANLNLEALAGEGHGATWSKVREKVVAGKMPPPGQAQLSKSELSAVTSWIDSLTQPVETVSGSGRVMARRLNRVEYNNTVRDLLGVPGRPADEFPVDDSGYGFDNIADVLTVSPMLMEKYMAAANRISRLAVFGEAIPEKPTRLVRLLNRRSHDASDVLSNGNYGAYLPYSLRGAMYGSWTFPVDAEYEFRLRIANFRPGLEAPVLTAEERKLQRAQRAAGIVSEPTPEELKAREEAARNAAPPRKLILTVDGTPVITTVVEGTATFGYERGEFVARAPIKAGERFLRASYPELADLEDPRLNINPDKRRGLFVDYLEIVGPFNASKQPPPSYQRLFVCGHAPGGHASQCGRTIVNNLLKRAYRRPVTQKEVKAKLQLVALAQKDGDSFEEGIRLTLEAVLASPDFLFRSERNVGRALSDHEFASRLSYFLWSSMPDEDLRRAADANSLRKPPVLEAQVKRMLADPKASNLVENFAAQWLQLRNLGRTKPDPARFPTFDDELLDAMKRETNLFVEAVFREDRSILDFIDAPFTFLNGPLARHYGIAGVSGEEFRRVNLDGEQRSGLLTQGAILTVSSYPTRTSPPVRGKWVLENLLGAAPPPPPPDVPVLDESKNAGAMSLRERLEQHRKDPSCSACHNSMDPIGFGLESYDGVGSWRTHDGKVAIDTSGVLPDGKSFKGAKDLKQILRSQSEAFTRNFTEKLMTFALGRGLESYDSSAVEEIVKQAALNDYKFSNFVLGVVNSRPFLARDGEGGKL